VTKKRVLDKTMPDRAPIVIRGQIIALTALLLGGCTDIGFSRGGSANEFSEASRRCEVQQSRPYDQCMAAAGWRASSSTDTAIAPASLKLSAAPRTDTGFSGPLTAASWWKFGGSEAELGAARLACAAGDARAISQTTLVCMEQKGWHPAGR
jgi:hypothetical protein